MPSILGSSSLSSVGSFIPWAGSLALAVESQSNTSECSRSREIKSEPKRERMRQKRERESLCVFVCLCDEERRLRVSTPREKRREEPFQKAQPYSIHMCALLATPRLSLPPRARLDYTHTTSHSTAARNNGFVIVRGSLVCRPSVFFKRVFCSHIAPTKSDPDLQTNYLCSFADFMLLFFSTEAAMDSFVRSFVLTPHPSPYLCSFADFICQSFSTEARSTLRRLAFRRSAFRPMSFS